MNRKSLLYCTLFFIQIQITFGQSSLINQWDLSYQLGVGKALSIGSVQQSINGWIVIVGAVEVPQQNRNGFFLVVDPNDGNTLFQQNYGGKSDDVLLAAQQAQDGTFYLAGYSTQKQGSQAWLLHVDEEGRPIAEEYYNLSNEDRFTHLNLLPDGSLLVFGEQGKKNKGYIWVSRIEDMQMVSEHLIGNGIYENAIGSFQVPGSNSTWLGGNFTHRNNATPGESWLVELDENGNIKIGSEKIISANDFGKLEKMKSSILNNMVMIGTSVKDRQRDAWIVEIDQYGNGLANLSYGDWKEEFGVSICKTVQDQYVLGRQVYPNQKQIIVVDGSGDEIVHNISQSAQFELHDLLYTFDRKFMAIGIVAKARQQQVRIISLQQDQYLAIAKTESLVSCSQPILKDENGDGYLKKGERGAIVFDIINGGETDIIDGNIVLEGLQTPSNFNQVYFSFLPRGRKKHVSIPINGDLFIKNSLNLNIKVKERSQQLASFPFEIRRKSDNASTTAENSYEIITNWQTNYSNSRNHNNQTARVSESKIAIKHEAVTQIPLKSTDYKIKKNGVWLEDNKNGIRKIDTKEDKRNKYFRYSNLLSFEATLDTGYNEYIIEVLRGGKVSKRDTLLFNFLPNHPNLHVISVGPAQTGLSYNTKDAVDFAELMAAQAGKNYFNQVFIDTLVSLKQTTTRNLQIAFAGLQKRYRSKTAPNRIAKDDVIVIFISSHGLMVEDRGISRFKIMTSDYDPEYKSITSIDYEETILSNLEAIPCKKIVFIDACHSAAAGSKEERPSINKYILELNATQPGLIAISSSAEDEYSYENQAWQNGAFTKAIREVFSGKARENMIGKEVLPSLSTKEKHQLISLAKLYEYLTIRVPSLVKDINKGLEQHPIKQSDNSTLDEIKFIIDLPIINRQ